MKRLFALCNVQHFNIVSSSLNSELPEQESINDVFPCNATLRAPKPTHDKAFSCLAISESVYLFCRRNWEKFIGFLSLNDFWHGNSNKKSMICYQRFTVATRSNRGTLVRVRSATRRKDFLKCFSARLSACWREEPWSYLLQYARWDCSTIVR